MALDRSWSHGSRKLAGLLLAVTVPPLVVLVWLGVLLVGEDRAQTERRVREERQVAIRTVAQALDRSLLDLERHLTDGPVPAGLARLTLSAQGVSADPKDRVLWLPAAESVVPPTAFLTGEVAESAGRVDEAFVTYRDFLRGTDDAVRAGAFVRIARLHRKARRWDEALAAYGRLAALPHTKLAGAPADLIARRAIGGVLEQTGRRDDLTRAAEALRADLDRGRWTIDRETWELTANDIERWTDEPMSPDPSRRLMSRAAEHLWARPLESSRDGTRRAAIMVDDVLITVLARAGASGLRVLLVSPGTLETMRTAAAAATTLATGGLVLRDEHGRLLSGTERGATGDSLTMTSAETGLPWTIVLGADDATGLESRIGNRRWLLLSGLAMVFVFVGGAGFFLWRLVRRELAVSRLQNEFVAAVSHEFRTPLTSLRLAWEVLDDGDDVPTQERRSLYGAIGRNSERLHRLVESLLDLSRMESGRKPYDLAPLDVGRFVRDLVTDFQQEAAATPFVVEVEADDETALTVPGDRAALGHALWNLLDNAVKYSSAGSPVRVVARRDGSAVAIAVTDHGVGVPAAEQRAIFGRFVRGERARRLGVGGTGLGLAIVSHIVAAHRGSVTVESTGEGSTFTVRLPSRHDAERLAAAAVPV